VWKHQFTNHRNHQAKQAKTGRRKMLYFPDRPSDTDTTMANEGTTTDASAADHLASCLRNLSATDEEGTTEPKKPKEEDPELFKPHPPTEECPVCLVPVPLGYSKATYWPCCGLAVCNACTAEADRALKITNRKRHAKELPPMEKSCAFCRVPVDTTESESIKRYEERVEKGDTRAMMNLWKMYRDGQEGLARDEAKALELLHRAADLGSPHALVNLGWDFLFGELGLTKDVVKGRAYMEDAAKKGNVISRFILGSIAENQRQNNLAIRHYKLAAAAGDKGATKSLWDYFSSDKLTKAALEETLRAHHAACDEMNSVERERYEAWQEAKAGNDDTLKQFYEDYYEGLITAKELNMALKAHRSGDIGRTVAILLKAEKARG
jgi:TPR repeat protein